jgi:hypothetical protein
VPTPDDELDDELAAVFRFHDTAGILQDSGETNSTREANKKRMTKTSTNQRRHPKKHTIATQDLSSTLQMASFSNQHGGAGLWVGLLEVRPEEGEIKAEKGVSQILR